MPDAGQGGGGEAAGLGQLIGQFIFAALAGEQRPDPAALGGVVILAIGVPGGAGRGALAIAVRAVTAPA